MVAAVLLAAAVAGSSLTSAQTRGRAASTPAAAPKLEPAVITCPQVLGEGVRTRRSFCDVTIGRDVNAGIIVAIPPHQGTATLIFDLHNRHTYSEEEVKANRAFHRYTATIGVFEMDNTLVSRAVVQNEFRTAADLFDRITGGSGPGGLKAVAPTGVETVFIDIPMEAVKVSIFAEKLHVLRSDGLVDNFVATGRPVAVISNVLVEYRPPPARRAPARRR